MNGISDATIPPLDGSVTIPDTLDFHWEHNPTLPIYAYPGEGADEITTISYLEFGRACHRVAHALNPDPRSPKREVVAIIALVDTVLYHAVVVGLMKSGLVPFPISPRNTPAAVVNLLKKTSCHRLVTTQTTLQALLQGVKTEISDNEPSFHLVIEEIPSISTVYPQLGKEVVDDPFEPYTSLSRPSLSDVALYLHSSGSTGFPKAVPQSFLTMIHWAAFPCLSDYRDHRPVLRVGGMALPSFHTLGIYVQLLYALYGSLTVAVYKPVVFSPGSLPTAPTPDNVLDTLRRTKSNMVITIPAFINIWSQSPENMDLLKSLEYVGFSGGPLVPALGDSLASNGVKLAPSYGGTEFGSPTFIVKRKGDEKDWAYMEFSPRAKVRWIHQGDGTYECQFLTTETHSLPIENIANAKGYATSDLWVRHPEKDYLWKIVGRIDDTIIHSSGEKTMPGPMEDIVMKSPLLRGAVMFGREHDQPGILIEPVADHAVDVNDAAQVSRLRNEIWPFVNEANESAPAFSRLFKEMIIVSSPEKPLPRTMKGTVMRKVALTAYEAEIKELYAVVESNAAGGSVSPPPTWSPSHVQAWLLEQAEDINPGKGISPGADLFEQGFDSLSATVLRIRLSSALRSHSDPEVREAVAKGITQNTIYSYPSVERLTDFVIALVKDPHNTKGETSHKVIIEEMIAKYSVGLEALPRASPTPPGQNSVVLITGSTGNLGSHLLSELLSYEAVQRVYCLNRPSSTPGIVRHRSKFEDQALDDSRLASDKVVFVEGDASQDKFGLDDGLFAELRGTVTMIIHNAWRLDFNLALPSFEGNIRGTRNLIDFARSSRHASTLRFLFTSSVSSAQSWDRGKGPYPEEVQADATYAVGGGYGEGKYVTERILAQSGLHATSFRIGQISGGNANGAWATTDWMPMLVKSSLTLGVLPQAHGVVSWLPMDIVAKSMLDIAFSKGQPPVAVNLVHPQPSPWTTIIEAVKDSLTREKSLSPDALSLVPFSEWFARLEAISKSANEKVLENTPAIKLLEFFGGIASVDASVSEDGESLGLPTFETKNASRMSLTVRGLKPLGPGDPSRWVKYWISKGF